MSLPLQLMPSPHVCEEIRSCALEVEDSSEVDGVQLWAHPTRLYGIAYAPALPLPWGYWWGERGFHAGQCVWGPSWDVMASLLVQVAAG